MRRLDADFSNAYHEQFDAEDAFFNKREATLQGVQYHDASRPSVQVIRKKRLVEPKPSSVVLSDPVPEARELRDLGRHPVQAVTDVMGEIQELKVDITHNFLKASLAKVPKASLLDFDTPGETIRKTLAHTPIVAEKFEIDGAVMPEGPLDFDNVLKTMNAEQICAMRNSLVSELKPETLVALNKIKGMKLRDLSTRVDKNFQQGPAQDKMVDTASALGEVAFMENSSESASLPMAISPHDVKKLEWTEQIGAFSDDKLDVYEGMIAQLRFDFEGNMCSPFFNEKDKAAEYLTDHLNVTGLRNHGLLPDLPGYTIPELLIFLSSTFRPQKLLGLRLIRDIALKRCRIHQQIHHINGETKVLDCPEGGFGFGRRRFDDYLFQSVMIHEKLILVCVHSMKDFGMLGPALEALAALFAPAGSPLRRLDELTDTYLDLPAVVDSLPFRSNQYIDWFGSRRKLLRTDELVKLLMDAPLDMSAALQVGISEGGDMDPQDNLGNIPDGELQQRRTDPLLSLLLWGVGQHSNFLNSLVESLARVDPASSLAILRLCECLALHSEIAAEFVRRALVMTDSDGDKQINVLVDKLIMAQQCVDKGFEVKDHWDPVVLALLTMLRALCGTLKTNPSAFISNSEVDIAVAPLVWRILSQWLAAVASACEDEIELPVTARVTQGNVEEALEWLAILSSLSWDAASPGAILAMSETFQKWIPLVFKFYHKLKLSDLVPFCRLWTAVMKLTGGVANCGFASFLSRYCNRAVECFVTTLETAHTLPSTLSLSVSTAIYWTVKQFETCFVMSYSTLSTPVEGFVTSAERLLFGGNRYFIQDFFGKVLVRSPWRLRALAETPSIWDRLSKLTLQFGGDGNQAIAMADMIGAYSDWITSLATDVADCSNDKVHHLLYSLIRAMNAIWQCGQRVISLLTDGTSLMLTNNTSALVDLVTKYLREAQQSVVTVKAISCWDGSCYRAANPLLDSLVNFVSILSPTSRVLGPLLHGCGTVATLESILDRVNTDQDFKKFAIRAATGGVSIIAEENESLPSKCFLSTNALDVLINPELPIKDYLMSSSFSAESTVNRDATWIRFSAELLPSAADKALSVLWMRTLATLTEWLPSSEEITAAFTIYHTRLCEEITRRSGAKPGRVNFADVKRRECVYITWLIAHLDSTRLREVLFQAVIPHLMESLAQQGVFPLEKLAWLWLLRLSSLGDGYRKTLDTPWSDSVFVQLCKRYLRIRMEESGQATATDVLCGIPVSQFLEIPQHHELSDLTHLEGIHLGDRICDGDHDKMSVPELVIRVLS
eukprot:Blabericola_migrator_1__1281@NODE_1331_length_4785_cov_21_189487_g894_i0_p1_GENE_NODE_1331_length_4785_cov_21_189487_g894_i0NODE_1331_length_4785_cov_21_189487_g894_i0_p1_ORF_typecomplete_len1337_score225_90RPAP1_C/PF08620_10/8_8e13Smac_DIABLO/PF09057_10/0_15_NODE_1331_length_4785_cov_21_189487_g894_i01344012